jgi:hypothetical protein
MADRNHRLSVVRMTIDWNSFSFLLLEKKSSRKHFESASTVAEAPAAVDCPEIDSATEWSGDH